MAQQKFEDLVKAVQAASSLFDLGDDLPLLKAGFYDLQNRLHAVEAAVKAHPVSHASLATTAPKA